MEGAHGECCVCVESLLGSLSIVSHQRPETESQRSNSTHGPASNFLFFFNMQCNDSMKTWMESPVCPGGWAQVRRQGCLPCSVGL